MSKQTESDSTGVEALKSQPGLEIGGLVAMRVEIGSDPAAHRVYVGGELLDGVLRVAIAATQGKAAVVTVKLLASQVEIVQK